MPESSADPRPIIASLKCRNAADAWKKALPIQTDKGAVIATLVPAGEWALGDARVIQHICDWRQAAMDKFLVRFNSTFARSKNYLATLSVAKENRIFFMIYDTEGRHVGHIGMADIEEGSGELDNVMRGVAGPPPHLMHFALAALIDWCFTTLKMDTTSVRVLSDNPKGLDLYAGAGYVKVQEDHLFRRESEGVTFHDVVEKARANVDYRCVVMRVTRETFYRAFPWLTSSPG